MKFRIEVPDIKKILTGSLKCKTTGDSILGVWRVTFVAGKAVFFRSAVREQVSITIDAELIEGGGAEGFIADHTKLINAIDALKIRKHLSIVFDTDAGTAGEISIASRLKDEIPCIITKDIRCSVTAKAERFAPFDQARKYVSDDEARYFMCGVYVEVGDGMMNIAATDGRALYYLDNVFNGETSSCHGDAKAIVPPYAFDRPKNTERIMFSVLVNEETKKTYAEVVSYGEHFCVNKTTECVDGQFPQYRRVIPDFGAPNFWCDTKSLKEALKSVRVFLPKDRNWYTSSKRICLTIGGTVQEDGTRFCRVSAAPVGEDGEKFVEEGKVNVVCRYSGKMEVGGEFSIFLNIDYLDDALTDEEDTNIWFQEANRAFVVCGIDDHTVIMPMQLV